MVVEAEDAFPENLESRIVDRLQVAGDLKVTGITSEPLSDADKPPLGVCPRPVWVQLRREELARAIYSYVTADVSDNPLIRSWLDELNELVA